MCSATYYLRTNKLLLEKRREDLLDLGSSICRTGIGIGIGIGGLKV
jgi:hypothetical protein